MSTETRRYEKKARAAQELQTRQRIVDAAIDLHGTDTVHTARELGVPDERIPTIAGRVDGIPSANGADAADAVDEVARLVATGQIRVPIAASFAVEDIRAAVELQAGRHVHGKIVIDL